MNMSDNPLTTVKYDNSLGLCAHGATNIFVKSYSVIVNSCAIDRESNCKHFLENPKKDLCIGIVYGSLKHEIKRGHPQMIDSLYSAHLVQLLRTNSNGNVWSNRPEDKAQTIDIGTLKELWRGKASGLPPPSQQHLL